MLQSLGSQRVGHDWVTELNWTEGINLLSLSFFNYIIKTNTEALSYRGIERIYLGTNMFSIVSDGKFVTVIITKKSGSFHLNLDYIVAVS